MARQGAARPQTFLSLPVAVTLQKQESSWLLKPSKHLLLAGTGDRSHGRDTVFRELASIITYRNSK